MTTVTRSFVIKVQYDIYIYTGIICVCIQIDIYVMCA